MGHTVGSTGNGDGAQEQPLCHISGPSSGGGPASGSRGTCDPARTSGLKAPRYLQPQAAGGSEASRGATPACPRRCLSSTQVTPTRQRERGAWDPLHCPPPEAGGMCAHCIHCMPTSRSRWEASQLDLPSLFPPLHRPAEVPHPPGDLLRPLGLRGPGWQPAGNADSELKHS